jgi:glucose/arabinose dehydrogenase
VPTRNGTNQSPAFQGQTRVPEVKSNFTIDTQVVASGLTNPWGMDWLPDGRLVITQRAGSIRIVTTTGTVSEPLTGVPTVASAGQGGLLDISVAPDFATSRRIYFSYAEPRGNNQYGTSAAYGVLSANDAALENVKVIFQQTPAHTSTNHFGSRLVWDRDGNLYITMGERFDANFRTRAQSLDNLIGKVVRVTREGAAVSTNPFVNTANARPEIWSYGHRNMQGAALHPETGELWTIEHGPRGGDEINRPQAGKNYGWPTITYGIDYSGQPIGAGITSQNGMEQPIYYWDPVIAPSNMIFYTGDMFPAWRGNLLIGALVGTVSGTPQNPGGVVRIMLNGNRVVGEERVLQSLKRVRDLAQAADGSLYLINDDGQLVRASRRQ